MARRSRRPAMRTLAPASGLLLAIARSLALTCAAALMRKMPGANMIALAAVLAVFSAESPAMAQEDRTAARNAETSGLIAAPLYTRDDLLFLRHMIVHHRQAVVMSRLVPDRTRREALVRFASYVERSQAAETEVMQSLLDLAADRGLVASDHGSHEGASMAGLLSAAELKALAASSSTEFERLWLTGMIFHHEGALTMARAQQRRQLADGRRPYGIDVLVEDILVEQRAEIDRMRNWLGDWELRSIPGHVETVRP